jgi:hypothetical protein
VAASCILEGLLLLLVAVVESGIIADEDTINGNSTASEALGEEVDGSCSTGIRED